MSDYIKREDAIKTLEGWKISGEMILATVPSVDVVEVVRCKDCRHFRDRKLKLLDDIYECDLTGLVTKPDNYCNYGEGV